MLKNRGGFKRRRLFLIILLVTIFLIGAAFFGYKILTENKLSKFDIDAQNLNCVTSSDIANVIDKMNINYFYFKAESIESELRKKFVCIGRIESTPSYPDRLKLKLFGREAKFVITGIQTAFEANPTIQLSLDQLNATQSTSEAFPPKVLNQILNNYKDASGSAMFLVDEEGIVFEETGTNFAYPKLSLFARELRIGQKIPDDLIKKVAGVVVKLKEIDTPSDNLLVVGDKLIVDSKPRITFALNRPLDRQSASLQLILRQAKMNLDPDSRDTRSVESVDLRFDRPVVIYSSKKK